MRYCLKNVRLFTAGTIIGSVSIVSAFAQSKVAKTSQAEKQKPMNVLFLISDDMRTELNVYGSAMAQTPNLDQLARQGVRFEHAYCQYPLSGPSRASLLTGRRPTTSHIYGNGNREFFGATYPDWASLPKYFRLHGYASLRSGKVFHGGIDDTDAWTEGGEQRVWSAPISTAQPSYLTEEEYLTYLENEHQFTLGRAPHSDRWVAVEGEEIKNQGDTKVANRAIEYIKQSKESGQPFFIACGFSKPHSPLIAPKQFFDLYDVKTIGLPPDFASIPMVLIGFPAGAIRPVNGDLFMERSASPEEARAMIRAYLACVSYVDWNVGRVLAELDRQGLRENTIIVFWSDHGYQLGEKGKWSKAGSLWEQGARVPFIILDPRIKGNGRTSPRVVELLDIYPTLVDLCGLPKPDGLEGVSLKPLLDNPYAEWDRPAYTVWNEHGKGITGVAVRTERWRYAEFFGRGAGAFLTDPINDPKELKNLVYNPEYRNVVAELHKLASDYVAGKTELPAPASKR
jgi:arylsulfatase A-like enzyme